LSYSSNGHRGRLDRGVTIWLPLADVAEIAEFKNWDEVAYESGTVATLEPLAELGMEPIDRSQSASEFHVSRRFRIPFLMRSPDMEGIKKLILFRSQDEGKTWTPAAEAAPSDAFFRVSVEDDGPNWFAVQTVGKDGWKWPASPELFKPV